MSAEPSSQIALQPEISELERLNRWVVRLCEQYGLPERVAFQLDICLTELVTNIISYAYPDIRPSAEGVAVRFAVRIREVVVELEDQGIPFDPLAYVPPGLPGSLEDAQIGGRGLLLVRKYAGEMHYLRDGPVNRLRLVFPLSAP